MTDELREAVRKRVLHAIDCHDEEHQKLQDYQRASLSRACADAALAAIKAAGYAVVREEVEPDGAVVTAVDGPGCWRIEPVDVPFVTVDGLRVQRGETLIIERRALADENGDEVRG